MTTQVDANKKVISYLLSQGEKYTFAQMWAKFIKGRLEVIDAVHDINQLQADFSPNADEWTITEVMHHLITSSSRVANVVMSLSRGEVPMPSRIDPPRETTKDLIEHLRARLLQDSIKWSALTNDTPPAPSITNTAPHPIFGELHARAWYLFQRIHDLDHAGQIMKNKNSSGYPTAKSTS